MNKAFLPTNLPRTKTVLVLGILIAGCATFVCTGSVIGIFFLSNFGLPMSFGPTATPPSPNSVISKALATLSSAKSVRIKIPQDYQRTSDTQSVDFVAPDRIRYVSPNACDEKEGMEVIVIGQTRYERCSSKVWTSSQLVQNPLSLDSLIEPMKGVISLCAPRGSVSFGRLDSQDVWQIVNDCRSDSGGSVSTATATWLVDPHNYQLRKWVLESQSGGNTLTRSYEFSNYDDPAIVINAPPQSSIATATPIPPPPIIAIPFNATTSPPSGGFLKWSMRFALENQSDRLYSVQLSKGTLQTKEGFTYNVSVGIDRTMGFYGLINLTLPPGLRAKGKDDADFTVRASFGEQTHPQTLYLDGIGPVDVQSIRPEPKYPTDRPDSGFLSAPDTFDIPNIARISIDGFTLGSTKTYASTIPTLVTKFRYQNLNIGREAKIPDMVVSVFGKEGYVANWDQSSYIVQGNCGGSTWVGLWAVGPGQTLARDLCTFLLWGSKGGKGDLGLPTTGLKILLQIKDYNIVRVYNSGF